MNEHEAGRAKRRFRNLVIDESSRQVFLNDREITLTRLEFAILLALTDSPAMVCTPQELCETVWGYAWLGDDHVVETHIARLRAKLGESGRAPNFIHTVRGVGYVFRPDAQSADDVVDPSVCIDPSPHSVVSIHSVISILLTIGMSANHDVVTITAEVTEKNHG